MAQESYNIHPEVIRYFRRKSDLTQEAVAELCESLDVRQYQRIEKEGNTTRQRVAELAKAFNVDEKDLRQAALFPWYITKPYELYGFVSNQYLSILNEIRQYIQSFQNFDNEEQFLTLRIDNSDSIKTISIVNIYDDEDDGRTWTFRPVMPQEDKGLIFCKLGEVQKWIWRDDLKELKYDVACRVEVDGKPVVPLQAKTFFRVDFHSVPDKTPVHEGYRLFKSDAEFRVSLTNWISEQKLPLIPAPGFSSVGTLPIAFTQTEPSLRSGHLIISKVWLDENGSQQQAPWPATYREALSSAIKERAIILPIGINEPFLEDNAPPMAPDILTGKGPD